MLQHILKAITIREDERVKNCINSTKDSISFCITKQDDLFRYISYIVCVHAKPFNMLNYCSHCPNSHERKGADRHLPSD